MSASLTGLNRELVQSMKQSINTALPEVKQLYIVITAVLLCHQRDKVPQRVDSALTLLVGLQEEHPAC